MHQVEVQPVILGLDHWDLVDEMVNDGVRVPRNHSVNQGVVDSMQKLVEFVKLVAVSLEGRAFVLIPERRLMTLLVPLLFIAEHAFVCILPMWQIMITI